MYILLKRLFSGLEFKTLFLIWTHALLCVKFLFRAFGISERKDLGNKNFIFALVQLYRR